MKALKFATRLLGIAASIIAASWATSEDTFGYHTNPPYVYDGENCSVIRWKFTNHQHGCDTEASELACEFQCDSQVASHGCVAGETTSSGTCQCVNQEVCCEPNGCEAGHGGITWGGQYCPGLGGPDQCGCCQDPTPIILSLRSNSVRLSSAQDGVPFDFGGDGRIRRFAWPISPDDVWLVMDRNNNGNIDSGQELFGNATILATGEPAAQGYEALAELDANADGWVNEEDPQFMNLMVWRDVRRNGRVDPGYGELVSIRRSGITALSTQFDESQRVDEWGNTFHYRAPAVFRERPNRRFSWDVFLTSIDIEE
jgi:hypothetical protein